MPTLAKAQLIEPESPWGPSSRPLIMEAIENAGYPCARVALSNVNATATKPQNISCNVAGLDQPDLVQALKARRDNPAGFQSILSRQEN
jgi:hypothetical protein